MKITTPTNPYPDVPLPPGAVKAKWEDPGTPDAYRYFEGRRQVIERDGFLGDVEVYAAGSQYPDGSIKREIIVQQLHADDPMTLEEARRREPAPNRPASSPRCGPGAFASTRPASAGRAWM